MTTIINPSTIISKIDLSIEVFNESSDSKWAGISPDISDTERSEILNNQNLFDYFIRSIYTYITSSNFKSKIDKIDGKPLIPEETFSFSLLKLAYHFNKQPCTVLLNLVIGTIDKDLILDKRFIWSSVCNQLYYYRLQTKSKPLPTDYYSSFNSYKSVLSKYLNYSDILVPWLKMESINPNFLDIYKNEISVIVSDSELNTVKEYSKLFNINFIEGLSLHLSNKQLSSNSDISINF